MPHIVIPVTTLVAGTLSGNLIGTGTAVAVGDTFEIDMKNRSENVVLIIQNTGAGNAVLTVNAGVDPPSKREGMGLITATVPTTETRALQLEGGRHIQANGKVTGSLATTAARVFALRRAKGA